VCALKGAHIRAINLRCAEVSQPDSFILFANLAAVFFFAPDLFYEIKKLFVFEIK
jgi:hypothetical protein